MFKRMISDDSGAALVEYGLVVALISIASIGVLTVIVGPDINAMFMAIGRAVTGATPPPFD